jgi:hypothetical protein
MKKLFTLGLCGMFLLTGANLVAQVKDKKETRKEIREERRKEEQIKIAQQNTASIESLNFTFYPNTIEPEFGVTNDLNGINNFYFTVDKTALYLSLPYVGNFYANPVTPGGAPINITSNKFTYTVQSVDNVNMKVTIIPTDLVSIMNEGIQFVLYMNKKSGYARLVMSADNRQEITYTGTFS